MFAAQFFKWNLDGVNIKILNILFNVTQDFFSVYPHHLLQEQAPAKNLAIFCSLEYLWAC